MATLNDRSTEAKTPPSTLDPDSVDEPDRQLGLGHGTSALGPSDTSDSGSDVRGAPGLSGQVGIGLDTGTTSDPDEGTIDHTAGPDVGDANLDSDTDSGGTGEHATVGRDTTVPDSKDIDADRIVNEVDENQPPTASRERRER